MCISSLQEKRIHDWLVLGRQDYQAWAQLFREKKCTLAKVVNTKSEQSQSIAVKHITEDLIDRQSVNTFKT